MKSQLNIKDYFQRIGYLGNPKPDLETLKELHLLHVRTIPFENLNPLLKIPVALDMDSLWDKMVNNNRGGYCYEQNLLFAHVLQSIGFDVRPLAARVLIGREEDDISAKTHMLLLVLYDGVEYLCDVGFGSHSLAGPLELHSSVPQNTPLEQYKIIGMDDHYLMYIHVRNEWRLMYRFTTEKRYLVDFKMANWYTSTYPKSHFTYSLTVARVGNNCRYTLKNNQFRTHFLGGQTEKETIYTIDRLKTVLEDVFLIDIPRVENLDSVFADLM